MIEAPFGWPETIILPFVEWHVHTASLVVGIVIGWLT